MEAISVSHGPLTLCRNHRSTITIHFKDVFITTAANTTVSANAMLN